MAKSFNILKNRLPVERKKRIEERLQIALKEIPLAGLRKAEGYFPNHTYLKVLFCRMSHFYAKLRLR